MNAFSKNFLPVYSTEYKGFSRICFVVRQDAWPCKSDVMRAPRCAALTITTHIHAIVIIWGISERTKKNGRLPLIKTCDATKGTQGKSTHWRWLSTVRATIWWSAQDEWWLFNVHYCRNPLVSNASWWTIWLFFLLCFSMLHNTLKI